MKKFHFDFDERTAKCVVTVDNDEWYYIVEKLMNMYNMSQKDADNALIETCVDECTKMFRKPKILFVKTV